MPVMTLLICLLVAAAFLGVLSAFIISKNRQEQARYEQLRQMLHRSQDIDTAHFVLLAASEIANDSLARQRRGGSILMLSVAAGVLIVAVILTAAGASTAQLSILLGAAVATEIALLKTVRQVQA